jgi:hypothetical protein
MVQMRARDGAVLQELSGNSLTLIRMQFGEDYSSVLI